MSEKLAQQFSKSEGIQHDSHEFGDAYDDSTIDEAWRRLRNRTLGEAAVSGNVPNPTLQDMSVNHEMEKRDRGAIIELCFAGDKRVSIRPLSEYDVTSATTSKLPMPGQLRGYLEGRENVRLAKNKQTAELDKQHRAEDRDGYDRATLQAIQRFLRDNPRGENVLKQLDVESAKDMSKLSVKDSIRLVGYIVASATNYNHDATQGRHNEADSVASLDILERGLAADSSDDVAALGVCRNYADMTVSVFKSLQRINPNLRNTYCVARAGIGSATDGSVLRKGEGQRAHAWNDFISVLPDKEVAITTVDPTVGRIRESDGKLVNYDQTALRTGTHLRNMREAFRGLDASTDTVNAESIQDFYIKHINDLTKAVREKYNSFRDVPLSARRRLQGLSLEYAGVVREFSGYRADMSKMPRVTRRFVEQVAESDETILSPFEFDTVRSVIESKDHGEDKDRLLRSLEEKRQYAIRNNLGEFFRRNELSGSYPDRAIA